MIRFACPGCSATFTVGDEKAGSTTACPKCRTAFQIPEIDPPPKASPPVARAVRSPRRRDVDEEDDRPRRRARRDDDEDDEDRPRRRREREEDDDDYDRPRVKKKKKMSGLILAAGIVSILAGVVIGIFAGVDTSRISSAVFAAPRNAGAFRDSMPPEVRSALSQVETSLVFLQIYVYSAFVTAPVFLAAGIGLVIHMTWGRIVAFIAIGLAALSGLSLFVFAIMLTTVTINGKSPPVEANFWFNMVLRIVLLFGPALFLGIVMLNSNATRFLRSKL